MAGLGTALGDRLIASRPPRKPLLWPVLAGAALLVYALLVWWPGSSDPAEPALEGQTRPLLSQAAASVQIAVGGASPDARENPSSARARQQRALFAVPATNVSACGYAGATLPALSAELVRAHSQRGVLFGALATTSMSDMLINYVAHLGPLVGRCAAVVGFMDGGSAELTLRLRVASFGSYTTGEPLPAGGGQAGRWRHARALFRAAAGAGLDLVLSDVDVVWLRDPWPYMQQVFALQGGMDALISTDTTSDWTRPLPAHPRLPSLPAELLLERADVCGRSLNVGILALRGASAGARALVDAAAEAVSLIKQGAIDQGAINRRWKGEKTARAWRETRGLACDMLDGAAHVGVLPASQFLSLLGYSVRKLHLLRDVEPFAVHATFLRTQLPVGKLLRLREEGLFLDPPAHYEEGRFLAYTPAIPLALLQQPPIARGAVPTAHMALVNAQVAQFRDALAVARVLRRALVLPRMHCSCELGFGPGHVTERCDADSAISLPYDCPADHWLEPKLWLALGWAHRERGFLENPRVPDEVQRSRAHARKCRPGQPAGCCLTGATPLSEAQLRASLGGCEARVLELGEASGLLRGFADARAGDRFDDDVRSALSSWCCTTDPAYKAKGGLVTYSL